MTVMTSDTSDHGAKLWPGTIKLVAGIRARDEIIDRLMSGYRPNVMPVPTRWVSPNGFIPSEPMTPEQQDYFSERKDRWT